MRFPFRIKIALLTATFSAVPLVAVGWLLIDVNAQEVQSSSQALQIALTDQVAGELDDDVADADRTLRAIASALTDDSLGEDARLALALRLLDARAGLDVVAIYDARGALIDRMRDPRASDVPTPDALPERLTRRAREEGRALGDATRHGDSVRVLVVVPLRGRAGDAEGVTGFAAAPLSLAAAQRRLDALSRSQLASREGALMVVDGERRLLVHPDAARLLTPASEAAIPRGTEVATLSRVPSSREIENPDGRAWIATSAGLDGVPWAVIAQVPREVVYASLAKMRAIVVGTIAITLLAAFAAAFFFARRLSAPIATLVDFTKDLAARRFDRRVTIDTKDELSVLGDALSDAASELERSEDRVRHEIAIRGDLGRYLPAELVEQIIRREQSMELGGQRRPITVLFADVVAFTPLSDRLPPEEVVGLLNELFTLLTEAVFRHEGTVDKFVGDCVMAIWGAPTAQPDHAKRALLASQDMLRYVESANAGWKERFGVEVQLAIGVNTGDAVVGNVGSETRMEYTAIGDVVNVAARLEAIARPQQILVSRATGDAVGDDFELSAVGEREVPGRSAPIELFEVRW
jgi:class 3 adenylate cyclase